MSFVEFRPGSRLAHRVNDAVAASGLSRTTLYKLVSEGMLISVKVAGRRLNGLLRAGVQQYAAGRTAAFGPARTIQEHCKPLPTITGLIYYFRTASVPVFFAHGPGRYDRRCRRVAAKSNADEHSTRAQGGALEMFMLSKISRRSVEKRGYTATEACWYLGIG